MIKYWFKNRLFLDFLIVAVLAALFSFAFSMPQSSEYHKVLSDNSIYLNSTIDYQVPNPSLDQVDDIEKETFVDKVCGYYLTKTNIEGSKASKVNLMMPSKMDRLSITMFNDKTRIKSIENTANNAYLDETASSAIGAKIGDEIKITLASTKLSYVVTSIYKANSLFKEGTVIVSFDGDIKTVYESNASSKSLSGAFIDATDVDACSNYLKNYIPLGRLKDRSEFDSDEAYEIYTEAIMSGNYQNEITNFSALRTSATSSSNKAKNTVKIMAYVGIAVVSLLYVLLTELLRLRKSEKVYFGEVLKNKRPIIKYRIASFITGLALYLAITMLLQLLIHSIEFIIIPSCIAAVVFVLVLVLNIIQDKKYLKMGSKASCSKDGLDHSSI